MSNIMFDAREVLIPGSVYDRSKAWNSFELYHWIHILFKLHHKNSESHFLKYVKSQSNIILYINVCFVREITV